MTETADIDAFGAVMVHSMARGMQATDSVIQNSESRVNSKIANGHVVNDTLLPARIPEADVTPAARATPYLFSLDGTTTIITGGGRGIGITLAGAVLEASGHVACLDILERPAEEEWKLLKQKAQDNGLGLSYHQCDVTDEETTHAVFDEISSIAQHRGTPIKGTIACAGIQQKLPALGYPLHDFERILNVNVLGAFLTAQCAAKKMIEQGGGGSIVMIASISGNIANRVRHVIHWSSC